MRVGLNAGDMTNNPKTTFVLEKFIAQRLKMKLKLKLKMKLKMMMMMKKIIMINILKKSTNQIQRTLNGCGGRLSDGVEYFLLAPY
jgi:hypothetical protein